MKRRILKMPIWLFTLLCVLLAIILVVGITIAVIYFIWHKPIDPNSVPTDVKVESVEFNGDESLILNIGDEYKLEYTILPKNAKNQKVTFSSSDDTIVTVDSDGLVKAIAYGNAKIEIITQDGNMSDTIMIIVKMEQVIKDLTEEIEVSIASITVNNSEATSSIEIDLNSPLSFSLDNVVEEASYTWTSSDPNILKVVSFDDGNLVTSILSTGTVTLTLTVSSDYSEDIVKEFTITIKDSEVEELSITSIEVMGLVDYYEGSVIDLNTISLLIKYSNHTSKVVSLFGLYDDLDLTTNIALCEICTDCNKAKKTYNLTYKEIIDSKELSFDYTIEYYIIPLMVDNMKLTGLNSIYKVGSTVTIDRIIVTLNNGEIRYITLNDTINNLNTIDMNTLGVKELSVEYLNSTFAFYFEVKENLPQAVSFKVNDINDYYSIGSSIEFNSATVTYSDGSKQEISSDLITTNLDTINMNELGSKHLVFTYLNINYEKDIEVLSNLYLISGLKSCYVIGSAIDYSLIKLICYDNGITEYKVTDIYSNIELDEIFNVTVEGNKIFEIEYLGKTYKSNSISFIGENEVIELGVVGIEDFYYTGEAILIETIFAKMKDGEIEILNLTDVNTNLNTIDTNVKGNYQVVVSYNNVSFYKDIIIYQNIDGFNIQGLKKEYYINDAIDLNSLSFIFVTGPNSNITLSYNEVLPFMTGSISTNEIGSKTITINYENQTFTYNYEVKYYKYTNHSFNNIKSIYALGEALDFTVVIYCNDGTFSETIDSNSFVISGYDNSIVNNGKFTITITRDYLEEPLVIEHEYSVINPLSVKESSSMSFNSRFDFYVNIDKKYNRTSELKVKDNSNINVLSITEVSGNYLVSVEIKSNSTSSTIECYLEGTNSGISYTVNKINLRNNKLSFSLSSPKNALLINNKASLEVSIRYDNELVSQNELQYLTFTWSGNDAISSNLNKASFISTVSGDFEIKVVISDGANTKELKATVSFVNEPLTNLGFVIGSKNYGIGKEYVLASKYIRNVLTQKVPKVMTYEFEVYGSTPTIDRSDLVFFVKEEEQHIANFINGVLNVYEDGYVTLYLTTKAAVSLGYTSDDYLGIYIASWRVRCVDALYVNDYNHLKFAFDNGYKAVLDSNILLGPEVMDITYDPETNQTTRKLKDGIKELTAIARLSSSLYRIESTWSTKYITNIALLNNTTPTTTVYATLNITNDLYGNGYTLDASQYTTLGECLSDSDSKSFFRGPLKFVEALSLVRIYGQDDIGFLVQDNVTVDNVVFQNCDSAYMNINNKLDLSRLNNVGTVMEIMGDNSVIKNCRLRNGRNIIRAYGTTDKDQLMTTTINNCILSNAREFLVKIGANKTERTDTVMKYEDKLVHVTDFYTVYNMNMSKVSKEIFKGIPGNSDLVYSTSSPYLKKLDGSNYQPRNYDNYNDPYFKETYVKTDVTIKDSVLENCGFFGICLESMFAGPILGGYQYAPKDVDLGIAGFNYNGIYDISGTSYSAILHLVGDVRIYNWKNIDEFDSSTIMEQIGNPQPLLKLIGEETKLEFNIKEILFNVAPTDPTIIDTKDGVTYAHGGIAFYGGGKNYHILDLSEYTGYTFTTHDVSMNQMGDSIFVKCIPLMAGNEPFRFVMYDSTSELTYDLQVELYENNLAYSNIK